ncbi:MULTISPECIES: hypothetical protein [unclassified Roseateles]|uniref:hypothetical protein n=1 Tax=unclassified Roseateles TaxID=2626991 RepID=UPI0006F4793F|nr:MULTISPECIES: hypothetical protein [unclassified Roseateles]KQW44822.1 hypothetical protein ASC81_14730 [Pelomonas sp. Root405]KRA70181.1 hypothetical protein ASD88_18890 [Pelomonas sp. Root662]
MDNNELLPLLGGFLLGGMVTAGSLWGWLSRQLKRERQRVHNVEQARQLSAQQLTQARKQIEQVQRENHELRLAVRPTPRPAPAVEAPVDPAEAARLYAESKMQPAPPKEGPKAFKDTVVLKRSPDSMLD